MQTTSPYKTAAELGIEQWEHDGLVALIGPLSRGELAYNQGNCYNTGECGTAGCIGGWLAFFARVNSGDYVEKENGILNELYWGNSKPETSPDQGARAIVNFLTLGDPCWDEVMRDPADLRDASRDTLDVLHAILVADFDADDSGAMQHVIDEVA